MFHNLKHCHYSVTLSTCMTGSGQFLQQPVHDLPVNALKSLILGRAKAGRLFCQNALALDLRNEGRNCGIMTVQFPPQVTPFERPPEQVAFHRTELSVILSLYGRMVAAGEWRDYGISCLREVAVFSVFRRTAEIPLYRIEKRPKLRSKQGMYAVVGTGGQVLRRGHDLKSVLRILERKLIRAVE
jgi:hypothetical protein